MTTLREAAESLCDRWDDEWDCSATPGHPGMDKAVQALRAALSHADTGAEPGVDEAMKFALEYVKDPSRPILWAWLRPYDSPCGFEVEATWMDGDASRDSYAVPLYLYRGSPPAQAMSFDELTERLVKVPDYKLMSKEQIARWVYHAMRGETFTPHCQPPAQAGEVQFSETPPGERKDCTGARLAESGPLPTQPAAPAAEEPATLELQDALYALVRHSLFQSLTVEVDLKSQAWKCEFGISGELPIRVVIEETLSEVVREATAQLAALDRRRAGRRRR